MAFCSTGYFETVESIQKSLHEREKRRLKLEEELFIYSGSEERLTRLKCVKMRHYLKELCTREAQAKARNLELLRSIDKLVLNAKQFSVDYTVLHHLKLECTNHMAGLQEDGKKKKSELKIQKRINSRDQSRPLSVSTGQSSSQPAVISMGRQILKDTVVDGGLMSPRLSAEVITNHPLASLPQNSPLRAPRVSKASGGSSLSDDILNSSDFAERPLPFDCGSLMREKEVCGSKQLTVPHVTLKASEVCSHHRSVNSPESNMSLQHYPSQSPSPFTPHTKGSPARTEANSATEQSPIPDQNKSSSSSISSSEVDVTPEPALNITTDVSVSLSGNLHDQHKPSNVSPNTNKPKKLEDRAESGGRPFSKPEQSLSVEEFFFLLDNIEERLSAGDGKLYSSSLLSEEKLRKIISMCIQRDALRNEELNVCAAVVLQQLPWLLMDSPHGCLLHSDLVSTQWSTAVEAAHIRSCLSGDSASLWERWFRHALQLLRQDVLSLNSIVQLFTPLLVQYKASYTDKAEVLLKRLLTHAAKTFHSSESEDDSSCSLPSLLNDSGEIKMARPSRNVFHTTGTHETKAYQLLKQSVTQEKEWRNKQEEQEEEEEDRSDLKPSGLSEMKKNQSSSKQDMRNDPKEKCQTFTAVQSKAFWGDSDDTNSEIEMALRPKSHTPSNSDFDDFYE
ncbi:centrosomal protein kizuna isoform X2 [Trichomycterus rosablanca]|uniref:centrosomal protein kizuna isoform X2 n=1 Tax=Trichomycterus rosablanca TaxID=2290929 RepID=UPI002F353BA5